MAGSVAQHLALWAEGLRDIAAAGLLHPQNINDREAFRAIQTIALEMMALASGQPLAGIEPLRAPLVSRPTPLVGGDAAVIDDRGRLLLIRRADSGLWAMPGGFLAAGETPAQGVAREALEETGVRARARALVGVFDSRLCGTPYPRHLLHLVFLCQPLENGAAGRPSHAVETLDVGWFSEDELPAEIDPGHRVRIPEAFRVWRGDGRVFFDRIEFDQEVAIDDRAG
jgi:ADP-ribose pyrophosphatase YjhB (NUDIX family)